MSHQVTPTFCVACGEEYGSCGAFGDHEIEQAGCKLETQAAAERRAQRRRPMSSDLARVTQEQRAKE